MRDIWDGKEGKKDKIKQRLTGIILLRRPRYLISTFSASELYPTRLGIPVMP